VSALSPQAQALLKLYAKQKAPEARFNLSGLAEHEQKTNRGRFKVLIRVDGKFVAFDPSKPNGQTGCGVFDDIDAAVECIDQLSKQADARGELNVPEKHGWKINFDDPKNWDLVPMKLRD
jgi:hypothetical protein